MKQALAVVIGLMAALTIGQAQEEQEPEAPGVEALIREGLEAYKAGRHQVAIQRLQKAIGIIQKSVEKGLVSFLPAPAEGWKAEPPESQSGNWGAGESAVQWTQVSRRYERKSDGLQVDVTISDSPLIVQGQLQALKAYENPQMLQMLNQDPDRKIALMDEDGWKGCKITEKGERAQTTAICQSVMVQIDVSGDDAKVRDAFWNAVDRRGIAAAVAPPK